MLCPYCQNQTQVGETSCQTCKAELPTERGAGISPVLRDQVFEAIVRQAMGGAPWREISARPMKSHNIEADDVQNEVNRRLEVSSCEAPPKVPQDDINHGRLQVRLFIGIWLISVIFAVIFRAPSMPLVGKLIYFILYAGTSGGGILLLWAGLTSIAGAFCAQAPALGRSVQGTRTQSNRVRVLVAGLARVVASLVILRLLLSWLISGGQISLKF